MSVMIEVNKEMLIWAIERSGFTVDELAHKIPNLPLWLKGERKPSLSQLREFAGKVHIPFGYFFLKKPPEEKIPIPFFRTFGDKEKISLNLYETIITLQRRQAWLSAYLRDEGYNRLEYVGKFKNNLTNANEIANDIRKTLGLQENWASNLTNWTHAREHLIQKIEDIGIVVIFDSIVGNNTHRKISVEECRGFVLVDEYAPFMFINSADSKSAQIFTLTHELAHIWVGESAGFDFRYLQPADNSKEKLCDKVSAEFLVPERELESYWRIAKDIKELSKYFKVSQIVIARRLLDKGFIKKKDFFNFYENYIAKEVRKKTEKGGDFYNTQQKRLGKKFLIYLRQAIRENKLLPREAYHLTELRGETFNKLIMKRVIW